MAIDETFLASIDAKCGHLDAKKTHVDAISVPDDDKVLQPSVTTTVSREGNAAATPQLDERHDPTGVPLRRRVTGSRQNRRFLP